jgi:type IV secretory pathway VirB10-like protein
MCFGKGKASKANQNCQQCSELSVCSMWSKGDKQMAKKTTAPASAPAEEILEEAASPAEEFIVEEPAPVVGKGKGKKTAPAPPPPTPKKTKAVAPAPEPTKKVEKKSPYRAGSGLDLAFQFLASGYRTLEEVVKHVGGKWKNPDFLKTTSLLKPGPDKPWTTTERGGKYKITMK